MPSVIKLLHVDDDPVELKRVSMALTHLVEDDVGFEVRSFRSAVESLTEINANLDIDLVLLDIHMPERSGIDLLPELRKKLPSTLLVAYSNDKRKIWEALSEGADDFVLKADSTDDLGLRLAATLRLHKRSLYKDTFEKTVVGDTMRNIAARVDRIIDSAVRSVHIEGESGTGKEVVVELFERALPKNVPVIKINCGAISPNLLESELFGHVKGAFTGALTDKAGLIEAAHGGWIFLDEVAGLSTAAQISLLRAIDNEEIRRVGDSKTRKVNVRFISACHESLSEMVAQKRFRNDLWQRLKEVHLHLAPLRERLVEVDDFIDHFCAVEPGGPYEVSSELRVMLRACDWRQGNVRQLRNCIRAMTEKHVGKTLTPYALPDEFKQRSQTAADSPGSLIKVAFDPAMSLARLNDEFFLALLRHMAAQEKQTMRATAKKLGVPKTTFMSRLRKLKEQGLFTDGDAQDFFIGDWTKS